MSKRILPSAARSVKTDTSANVMYELAADQSAVGLKGINGNPDPPFAFRNTRIGMHKCLWPVAGQVGDQRALPS